MSEEVEDVTLEILRQIRDEIRNTNARLDSTNSGLERLELELVELRADTRRGFMLQNARFDNLRDRAGERDRSIEERVAALEERLGRLEDAQLAREKS
ncbi:MAG: hypothetical protein FJ125_08580 [Deltaproteobacteria bacterium]|nr:hypothetical protein [Deltaproteobacteria bacterium]